MGVETPLVAPGEIVPNTTGNEEDEFRTPGTSHESPTARRKGRKANLRRLVDKNYTADEDGVEEMDETNEDYVVKAGSETEIDQSEDEEVMYKGRIITKRRQTSKSPGYQRRERFLSGTDFVEHPYFREFATGPSPAVNDRDDPRALFYCRMCKIDISTDKTFSRTPANLV